MNLYKRPLKYDPYNISIEETDIGVRVWDKREGSLFELIVDLPGNWTLDQVSRLIFTAQQVSKYSFEEGRESKQYEIRRVLGIKER